MSSTSAAPVQARADRAVPQEIPVRAEGVQLLGEMQGSGYRRPPALVRRADGQTVTLTPLLYLTLRAVDGRRGADEIASVLSSAVDRHVTAEDVAYLVHEKLRPLGLVVGADGAQPVTRRANPLLALRLKVVVTNPELTRRITAPFAWLFKPAVAIPMVLAFLALSWWVLIDKGLASAAHQALYEPGFILAVWAMVVVSAGFHEFGHAAACRYGGATPGVMGAGLYLVWPAFYTDVTDSYRLSRAARLRVDLGGLYFNALFALATWVAWAVFRTDALLLVILAQHLQMIRQLAPFIRADGYHIIADLTGVPDLFAHIKPTLLSVLPRRWRPAGAPRLKRWARAVVVLWVATVVPMLVSVIVFGVLLLPRIAATAWDSMGQQWHAAMSYWGEGDIAAFTVRALSALLVALPVAGLVYLLVRLGRRVGRSAWRSTEGSPRKRAGVLVLVAAALAGVVWAWWPAEQYQPIDGDSDGTLADIVRVEDRRIFLPLLEDRLALRAAPTTSQVSSTAGATGGDAAGGAVVTAMGQAAPDFTAYAEAPPAQSAARAGATTRDAWPFPFPMPEPPAEGDNRAWAVNTTDGTVVTDMAVSWALVTANEVAEANEAWALASCEDCIARAVAFQILLITSDADIITPVNAALAANYECSRCATEALAVQLVVSLTGMPSTEAQALIGEAMARVERLEADLDTLDLGQVYYVIQATQEEVMEILRNDGVIPAVQLATTAEDAEITEATPAAEAGPTDETTASTTEATAEPSTETTSEATAEPTTEPTAEPTDPSTEPTAEPTAEPTTDPSTEPTAEPTTDPSTEPSPTP